MIPSIIHRCVRSELVASGDGDCPAGATHMCCAVVTDTADVCPGCAVAELVCSRIECAAQRYKMCYVFSMRTVALNRDRCVSGPFGRRVGMAEIAAGRGIAPGWCTCAMAAHSRAGAVAAALRGMAALSICTSVRCVYRHIDHLIRVAGGLSPSAIMTRGACDTL